MFLYDTDSLHCYRCYKGLYLCFFCVISSVLCHDTKVGKGNTNLTDFRPFAPPRGAAPAALANKSKSASARQVLPLRGSRSTVYPARFAGSLALIPRSGPSVSLPAEVSTPAHGRRLSTSRCIVSFRLAGRGRRLGRGKPPRPCAAAIPRPAPCRRKRRRGRKEPCTGSFCSLSFPSVRGPASVAAGVCLFGVSQPTPAAPESAPFGA